MSMYIGQLMGRQMATNQIAQIGTDWSRIELRGVPFNKIFGSQEEELTSLQIIAKIREIKQEAVIQMGANDPCFCGSGKKHKRCHGDISENSAMANLIQVFGQLDAQAKEIKSSACEKGCADCCNDYFTISVIEFLTILNHLKIKYGESLIKELHERGKAILPTIAFPEDDNVNIEGYPPCLFVDNTTKECKIYEVRPVLCRTYGVYEGFTRCERALKYNNLFTIPREFDLITHIDNIEYQGQKIPTQLSALVY